METPKTEGLVGVAMHGLFASWRLSALPDSGDLPRIAVLYEIDVTVSQLLLMPTKLESGGVLGKLPALKNLSKLRITQIRIELLDVCQLRRLCVLGIGLCLDQCFVIVGGKLPVSPGEKVSNTMKTWPRLSSRKSKSR